MRRRVWGGLGKIWLLAIAMIMALGTVGITYSGWIDTININGTVHTGTMDPYLKCGLCSPNIRCYCAHSSPETLQISVDAAPAGNWYCDFTFTNDGSLPVKINSFAISPVPGMQEIPGDATISVTGIAPGDIIDPGTVTGKVNINLAAAGTFIFTVTVYYGPFNG
jgi:hypothetical protein